MSNHLTVELVDGNAARASAADDPLGYSRGGFLRRALVAGGVLSVSGVVIGGLPALAEASEGKGAQLKALSATEVLNFALTLEYLEAEFYTQAEAGGALRGEALRFARTVGAHERAHVDFLKGALGANAVAKPTFDFKGTTSNQAKFLATAIVLEDTGVAAYNGQAANLKGDKTVLAAAASVVSVEARHAAWVRDIVRKNPAPVAFDPARSREKILEAVAATGFIAG